MCTKRTGELLWEKHTEGIKLQSLGIVKLQDMILLLPRRTMGKIITSEDSYFYDYNAVKAAKVKSMNFSSKNERC